MVIDDGWQGKQDASGVLRPNERFPDMKALADYVHGKGLKLGIYSSPGHRTCGNQEGSYGHEEQDAKMFADWGIDYLKYDWCGAFRIYKNEEMQAVYQKMGALLRQTGRPIVYGLCQYGMADVWKWGPDAGGNLWRTTGDIDDTWPSMEEIGFSQSDLAQWAGPGHWNDPDMLEVGNGGMAHAEYRTHMSLWSLLAAPLLAGNDLRTMSKETLELLINPEVIAIDQDLLGRQGRRVSQEGKWRSGPNPLPRPVAAGLFNRGQSLLIPHALGSYHSTTFPLPNARVFFSVRPSLSLTPSNIVRPPPRATGQTTTWYSSISRASVSWATMLPLPRMTMSGPGSALSFFMAEAMSPLISRRVLPRRPVERPREHDLGQARSSARPRRGCPRARPGSASSPPSGRR